MRKLLTILFTLQLSVSFGQLSNLGVIASGRRTGNSSTGQTTPPPVVVTPPPVVTPPTTINSYTLAASSTVSAGVYKQDNTLVRTLFSGVSQPSGTYSVKWDGTDDFFQPLPVDNYNVKVVSNNVQYTWQGTIGNTSTNLDENTRHKALEAANNMVIVGSNAYYTVGYNEGGASLYQFSLNNIQTKVNAFKDMINQTTDYVCTDGTNIYWTAYDNYAIAHSWVFATKVSDNSLVSFSSGSSYKVVNGFNFTSCIDHRTSTSVITGIAVSGSYLFTSYKAENLINVTNKSTGAFVRSISITSPTSMAVDGSNIWIASGTNTLQKYPINSDGTIGTGTTSISGLSEIADVRVNGTTLAVIDGGSNQQVKTFSTSTGASNWTFGQSGGVKTAPLIVNDRFGFWKLKEATGNKDIYGGIAFASDGSFWVCDPSNQRMQHYDASRSYLQGITYQRKTYTCYVNPANHTRVIGNFIEFQVDYSSPIGSAWVQKYNWEGKLTNAYNIQEALRDFTTLSNGRTYALIINRISGQYEQVELDVNTGLRFQGISIYDANKMYANGDIYNFGGTALNETQVWKKRTLTGFDTNGWPTYSSNNQILTNAQTTIQDARLSGAKVLPWEVTSSNILVNFRGNKDNGEPTGAYHLRGINPTTGATIWQSSPSTNVNYTGTYPTEGSFDIGNGANYLGNVGMAIEKNIIWGYNGESWKQGQTNKWNHYYDNGLFIGQFGTTSVDFKFDPITNAAMAGNSFAPAVVREGNDYYMYHNDESYYSGLHRWKITGLSTIQEQVVPISSSFVRSTENALPGTDLMASIPLNAVMPTSVNGWTRTPDNAGFTAKTTVKTYDKRKPTDIFVHHFGNIASTYNISRSLGSNFNVANWQVKGQVTFDGCMPNFLDFSGLSQFIDVLDNNGKIITRFHQTINYSTVPASSTIWANTTAIATGESNYMRYLTSYLRDLSISKSGSSVVVSFANYNPVTLSAPYETGANISNPTTLRLTFPNNGQGNMYEKFMGVTDLRYIGTAL